MRYNDVLSWEKVESGRHYFLNFKCSRAQIKITQVHACVLDQKIYSLGSVACIGLLSQKSTLLLNSRLLVVSNQSINLLYDVVDIHYNGKLLYIN